MWTVTHQTVIPKPHSKDVKGNHCPQIHGNNVFLSQPSCPDRHHPQSKGSQETRFLIQSLQLLSCCVCCTRKESSLSIPACTLNVWYVRKKLTYYSENDSLVIYTIRCKNLTVQGGKPEDTDTEDTINGVKKEGTRTSVHRFSSIHDPSLSICRASQGWRKCDETGEGPWALRGRLAPEITALRLSLQGAEKHRRKRCRRRDSEQVCSE